MINLDHINQWLQRVHRNYRRLVVDDTVYPLDNAEDALEFMDTYTGNGDKCPDLIVVVSGMMLFIGGETPEEGLGRRWLHGCRNIANLAYHHSVRAQEAANWRFELHAYPYGEDCARQHAALWAVYEP